MAINFSVKQKCNQQEMQGVLSLSNIIFFRLYGHASTSVVTSACVCACVAEELTMKRKCRWCQENCLPSGGRIDLVITLPSL